MLQNGISAESEARWQAWLAKGRLSDARWREKVRLVALILFSAAALAAAFIMVAW
jgi:hypothetical protein